MDLEALDSPKYIDEKEAFPKQVKEEEVPLVMVVEAQPSILEELSPSNIMIRVMSELTPQEDVAKSKSSGREELNNAPTEVLAGSIEEGRLVEELIEHSTALIGEEGV